MKLLTKVFQPPVGRVITEQDVKVGNDLIMPVGKYYKKEILEAVKSGRITEDDVRRCCTNVVK